MSLAFKQLIYIYKQATASRASIDIVCTVSLISCTYCSIHPLSLHKRNLSVYKFSPYTNSLFLHYPKKRFQNSKFSTCILKCMLSCFFKWKLHFHSVPLKLRPNLLLLFTHRPINTITTLGKLGERSMDLVALFVWLSWSVLIADCYGVCASRLFSTRCVFGQCWLCWRCAPPPLVLRSLNGEEA